MKSILCPIAQNARRYPDSPAIIDNKKIITYKQLDRLIDSTVAELIQRGLNFHNRAICAEENSRGYIIALLTLWRLEITCCLLNTRLPTQTKDKQANALISPARSWAKSPSKTWDLSKDATIIFTSGSSGEPKAALHTFGNHVYSAWGSNAHIPLKRDDRWLLSLPLYHVGGLSILFRCFLAGACVVVADFKTGYYKTFKKFVITHASLVPTQLYRMLQENKEKTSLKTILLGGAAIPETLLKKALGQNLPVYISYGLTEMSSQVATSQKLTTKNPQPKVKVLKYRRLKIARDGEILVKGETLFKGYVNKKIHRPLNKDGWFKTGDVGEFKNGLKVFGRKDNMFICGGENIQPEEIEAHLKKIKGIEDAVVVPKDDKEFGQRPVAFIKSLKKIQPHFISNKLCKHLPKFKIPVAFYSWPNAHSKKNLKIKRKLFRIEAEKRNKEK